MYSKDLNIVAIKLSRCDVCHIKVVCNMFVAFFLYKINYFRQNLMTIENYKCSLLIMQETLKTTILVAIMTT